MSLQFRDDAIATLLPSRDEFPNFTQRTWQTIVFSTNSLLIKWNANNSRTMNFELLQQMNEMVSNVE